MENNEVKKKSKKKIVKVILLIVLVVVLIILSPLLFLVGSIFSEMIFNRPSTPEIKHAEVPFVLTEIVPLAEPVEMLLTPELLNVVPDKEIPVPAE